MPIFNHRLDVFKERVGKPEKDLMALGLSHQAEKRLEESLKIVPQMQPRKRAFEKESGEIQGQE